MYEQAPPYCIQIELSEGCNLRCPFCGLNGIRGKENNYKFMTTETATKIASDMAKLGWNSRLEFAMHGEPTMNPEVIEILSIFRQHLPKAYMLMESNGGGIAGPEATQFIDKLFRAGLTTLALDQYQNVNLVPKIMAKMSEKHQIDVDFDVLPSFRFSNTDDKVQVYVYPNCGPAGNPHQRKPIHERRLVWIKPIDLSTSGTHANLNNHGGAGAPRNYKAQGKRCAKPFREMSVRWNGGVAVCCNDWRGELPIGNVNEIGMDGVWHHPVLYAARRKLYAGERDFAACNGCDALSYRPGLLPDHLGQEELDAPDELDAQLIAEAMALGPMTTPVKRPWELTNAEKAAKV